MHSIRTKLLVLLLLLSLGPLIVSDFNSERNAEQILTRQLEHQLLETAQVKQAVLENHLHMIGENALGLASTQALQRFLSDTADPAIAAAAYDLLLQYQENHWGIYHHVFLARPNGDVVLSPGHSGSAASHLGENISESEFFEHALVEPQVTDFFGFEETDHFHQLFMQPVKDAGGATIGLLVFEVSIDYVKKILADEFDLGQSGRITLATLDGIEVVDKKEDLGSKIESEGFQLGKQQGVAIGEYRTNGREVLGVYLHDGNYPWILSVEIDLDEAFSPIQQLRIENLIVLAISVLALVILGIVSANRLSRPLMTLVDATKQLAAGDTSVQVAVSSNDEIGQLGQGFNDMAVQIHRAQQTAQESLQEASIKANIVENTPTNIIVADADFNITYINPQSLTTFKEIADVLPCKPEDVVGKSIDFFHKDPAHQRKILSDPNNLPYQANIQLGHHTLDLYASAVYNGDGDFIGPMVTWEVITEKLRMEHEAQQRTLEIEKQREKAETQRTHILQVASQVMDASNSIASASEELSRTSAQMATGSENQQVTVQGVAAAVEEMTQSARGVSDNMDELARLMTENAAALNELSSSVASVTQNADQMSQTVIANSSAIEELAASVQTQADGAQQANDTAREASKAADEGSQVVRQAIGSMERIAERVRSSSATIGELGKSSEQISTIVAVINDIADQTNLLALNAAIEAARAGEQGKGFMVVADEVRKLAERTSQATQEIDDMIRKIQTDTQDVVVSMEAGMSEVEEGTELASKSGEALAQIGEGIGRVNALMGQLTEASREQATTSDEIVRSTAEMNELVQQVTGAMNEQSQAVEMVSQSSEEVQGRVDQVANAMREQTSTAMQIAQSMEEVNGVAGEALQSAREMDKATSELARQAEALNELANDGDDSHDAKPANGSAAHVKARA